jgi:hypothetical protein
VDLWQCFAFIQENVKYNGENLENRIFCWQYWDLNSEPHAC